MSAVETLAAESLVIPNQVQEVEPASRVRSPANSAIYESFRASLAPEDYGWQEDGNCRGVDPDLFFPEKGASQRAAKEVCKGCVVREECLDYALSAGEKFGIWGGLSERERRRIRRQRAQAARSVLGA